MVNITEAIKKQRESPFNIHLGQSLSRSEKMDWAIQKSVELGVNEISPLFSDHCARKLDTTQSNKRNDHWQNIIISACEQSGRSTLPILNPLLSIDDWLNETKSDHKLFFHPDAKFHLAELPHMDNAMLLIGPEGGLSTRETQLALSQGFKAISLGPRILRTETAALAAIAILQNRFGDL